MSKRRAFRIKRHKRVRGKITGTTEIPRLSVYRSHQYIFAQIIDDTKDTTIVGISDKQFSNKSTKTEAAEKLGEMIAKKAKDAKISKVVFDRGGHRYLGRVKTFAESARKNGLQF